MWKPGMWEHTVWVLLIVWCANNCPSDKQNFLPKIFFFTHAPNDNFICKHLGMGTRGGVTAWYSWETSLWLQEVEQFHITTFKRPSTRHVHVEIMEIYPWCNQAIHCKHKCCTNTLATLVLQSEHCANTFTGKKQSISNGATNGKVISAPVQHSTRPE